MCRRDKKREGSGEIDEIAPVKGSIHDLERLSASLHSSEFYAELSEGHTRVHTVTHVHVNSHTHVHVHTHTHRVTKSLQLGALYTVLCEPELRHLHIISRPG